MSLKRFWILNFINFLLFVLALALGRKNRFAVKMDVGLNESIKETLKQYNFSLLYEITPETFIIEYNRNNDLENETMAALAKKYPEQILCWEHVRIYANTLKPADVPLTKTRQAHPIDVSEKYYGMNIEDVWRRGYTGKGITIAVADVGINANLLDLKKNVRKNLCKNFVNDSEHVTPELFLDSQVLSSSFTDHGNNVASIIAAEQGNNICTDGIAYNSSIAAFKIFEVKQTGDKFRLEPYHWTASDIVAKALIYKLDEIDIFVNAWSPTIQFDNLDLLTTAAIEHGATKGRQELGTLYLVPAGPVGNSLSNNIHTITVGSIGQYGTVPSYALIDASVITSGLSDGSNLTADTMFTASYGDGCVSSFKGLSAATAQIAGIIALGLEANPRLSLRDVQELLVLSSEHTGLKDSASFRQNGAKRYVHGIFGYGLLNATKFVEFAADKRFQQSNLLNATLQMKRPKKVSPTSWTVEFCFHCPGIENGECLTNIEQVVVFISLKSYTINLKIGIISPYGTLSVLMDEQYQDRRERSIEGMLVSTHFWDESSFGEWQVMIQHHHATDTIHIESVNVTLTLYGTLKYEEAFLKNYIRCEDTVTTTQKPNDVNQKDSENIYEKVIYLLYTVGPLFGLGCVAILFFISRGWLYLISHIINPNHH